MLDRQLQLQDEAPRVPLSLQGAAPPLPVAQGQQHDAHHRDLQAARQGVVPQALEEGSMPMWPALQFTLI